MARPHPLRVIALSFGFLAVLAVVALICVIVILDDLDDPAPWLRLFAGLFVVASLVFGLLAQKVSTFPTARRTWSGTATVEIARPSPEVWMFIRNPGAAHQFNPEVVWGKQLSGTPHGVGEQLAFLIRCRDGSTTCAVVEVVAEDVGVALETRSLTGPSVRQRVELATVPTGTRYRCMLEVSLPRFAAHGKHPRRMAEAGALQHVEAVKRAIESEPPSVSS